MTVPTYGRILSTFTLMIVETRPRLLVFHQTISARRGNYGVILFTTGTAWRLMDIPGGSGAFAPHFGRSICCASITFAGLKLTGKFQEKRKQPRMGSG